MHIILYHPGAAGELVTSMIDPADYHLDSTAKTIAPDFGCFRRKITEDTNLTYKNFPISVVWEKRREAFKNRPNYRAFSSHDFEYFLNFDTSFTSYILIDNTNCIDWAIKRFTELLSKNETYTSPSITEELVNRQKNYINLALEKNITDKVIKLEDIRRGKLVDILKQWIDTPLHTDWYEQWLEWHGL